MIVLGIVGSPAGGKSTVATRLECLGATWIDADRIAHHVLEEGDVQAKLLEHFGEEIANSEGQIDRSKLASRVFGDDDAKRAALTYLEGLIHPRTRRIISDRIAAAQRGDAAVAILDVPLLFKSGWDKTCDEVWCVDADRNLRLKRVARRGWDADQLRVREANQLDIQEKKRLSTVVIMNNGLLDDLHGTIDRLWHSLLERRNETSPDSHCQQFTP